MEEVGANGFICVLCGHYAFDLASPKRAERTPTTDKYRPHHLRNGHIYEPCPVIGCDRQMEAGNDMCARCRAALRDYEEGAKRKAPPIAKNDDGKWYLTRKRRRRVYEPRSEI